MEQTTPDTLRAHRLAPTIVIGTRLSASASATTPARVHVADPRVVAPGPGATADAIGRLPGVSSFDDQGTRAQPTLGLRGFTLSPVVGVPQGISVFLDGVRINEADAQQVHFDLIPMSAVERIELIRGPSALHGKNSLAGALVLTTRRGDESHGIEAQASAGAFGYRGGQVIAGGSRAGIDALLLGWGSSEDGYRNETGATTRMLFATIGRRAGSSDLALSVLRARDRMGQAGSLPASWLRVDRRANYTAGDFVEPDLLHVNLRGERTQRDGVVRGHLFTRRGDTEQFNVNVGDPNTRAFVRTAVLGGAIELTRTTRLLERALAFTLGGEYARGAVRYRVLQEPNADAPLVDAECDPGGVCERASVNQDDAALFAQAVLNPTERIALTTSLRADYVRIPFRDLRDSGNDGTSSFRRLSPRFGATARLARGISAYAALGTGFRAPAALELACADEHAPCPLPFSLGDDPPLEAVSVRNMEAGMTWEPGGASTLEVSAFRTDVRDEIVFVASRSAAGFFRNIPRTRRQGVEISARAALPKQLRLFASYAYLDAEYRSGVRLASAIPTSKPALPGDRFPLTPAHRGSAGLGVAKLAGSLVLDAEITVSALSRQFLRGDDANDFAPLGGYATTGLRLAVEHPRVAVSAHVMNLFGRRYETFGIFAQNPRGQIGEPAPPTASVERFLTPGYPRSVTLSLRLFARAGHP